MNNSKDTLVAALGAALTPPVNSILEISVRLPVDQFPEDVERIQRNAKNLHGLVRTQLSPTADGSSEALSKVRHDARGVLGNIQNFAQLLLTEDCPDGFVAQLESLLTFTKGCSSELNANSESTKPAAKPEPVKTPLAVTSAEILVVDDDPDNRRFLNQLLSHQGHQIDQANNGRQAITKMGKNDYDLVLLDINMPKMNGIQVLQHLKEKNMLNHTPVLVISGEDNSDTIIQCIELGAEDFFPRDFDQRLLLARVNACLEKQRLREHEFHQYFTPELARKLVRNPELLTHGTEREISILFCDIVRFSAISLRLGPNNTMRWLSDVMKELSDCVIEQSGVLVDYIGDELMAMWGAPNDQPNHAEQACRAATAMINKLPELTAKWSELTGEPTLVTIGVNSGEAFVGNVGTERKFKYGALGNTINFASRLQGATKFLRARTLITETTHSAISSRKFRTRHLCSIRAKNIDVPVAVYELESTQQPGWGTFRNCYERALSHFENSEFHKASAVLGNLLVKYPNDGPSLLLMSRVVQALLSDSPEEFDSVWTLPGK